MRENIKEKRKEERFLFVICVVINKISIQGGSRHFFFFIPKRVLTFDAEATLNPPAL